jgi:hypothetical protein
MLVADIHVRQLGSEIEILFATLIPEIAAACSGDYEGFESLLARPGVEHVPTLVLKHSCRIEY